MAPHLSPEELDLIHAKSQESFTPIQIHALSRPSKRSEGREASERSEAKRSEARRGEAKQSEAKRATERSHASEAMRAKRSERSEMSKGSGASGRAERVKRPRASPPGSWKLRSDQCLAENRLKTARVWLNTVLKTVLRPTSGSKTVVTNRKSQKLTFFI